MFNDISSPLRLLQTRRSGKARDMTGPGPDSDQLRSMLEVAIRTPDHGKIAPWRFFIIEDAQRQNLAELLERAYYKVNPDASPSEIQAKCGFICDAPTLVVMLSSPRHGHPIPLWEQELSAGAAAMNLLHAAHAMGFVGSWITSWPAFNDDVRDAFGGEGERITGFIFIGTAKGELQERPRPKYDDVVTVWQGK